MPETEVFQMTETRDSGDLTFPDPSLCSHPEGLVAWGGTCEPQLMLTAYRQGIFPWYEEGGPVLWWSPDPRMVFDLAHHQLPRRLVRHLRHSSWRLTCDRAFDEVIRACAGPREGQTGTWITPAMIKAFEHLHQMGWAHSIEVWDQRQLIGGVYGLVAGRIFCAESKFHRKTNASKVALAGLFQTLRDASFELVDAQVHNPHLVRLGAVDMSRKAFLNRLKRGLENSGGHPRQRAGDWSDIEHVVGEMPWEQAPL